MKDITGKKYGRLTAIEYSHTNNDKKAVWKCICDCGNVCFVSGKHMRSGNTTSCGCYGNELRRKSTLTHGGCVGGKSKDYYLWLGMIDRCRNKNKKHYHRYGGRGIVVCGEWMDFGKFMSDMGPRPDGYSIERIDNNGDYTPENCRWASKKDQANNRSNNRILKYKGRSLTVSQWADEIGLSKMVLYQRLYRKWSIKRTLTHGVQ